MPLARRKPLVLAVFAASAALVTGCEDPELIRTQSELARVRVEADKLEKVAKAATVALSAEAARVEKLAVEKLELERRLGAAQAAAASAASAAPKDAKTEKIEKDLKDVRSHRDELVEWVEKELLPVAEANDPKLVFLRQAADEMGVAVAKYRKLPWKHDVMRRHVTRDQVGTWMQRDLRRDLPEEEARKMVAVGSEFGIMKRGTSLYDMFSSFMESGAAAFYKPNTRTFYHIEGNDGRGAYPVVFHELVHAIEDQHFDLDAFYKQAEKDSDKALAYRGLCEGSASFFEELYAKDNPADRAAMMKAQMNPKLMKKQQEMLNVVPPFLIGMMGLYPYKNGMEWVRKVSRGDPARVDRLYSDPPVTTEQVLHPERFDLDDPSKRDWPHTVAEPDLTGILSSEWTRLDGDNNGELVTGMMLVQLQQPNNQMALAFMMDLATQGIGFKNPVKRAVDGWDGDRYSAWVRGDDCCVVWKSAWDSEKDAVEFAETYAPLLAKKKTGEKPAQDAALLGVRFTDKETGRIAVIERRGAHVVTVLGAPPETVEALLAAGWKAEVKPDPRDARDAK